MALTDQVIMPGSDYQAICDATRTLTGKTGVLKSGDISTELGTVLKQPETWIINEVPNFPSSNIDQSIPFIAAVTEDVIGGTPFNNYRYARFRIFSDGRINFQAKDGMSASVYRQTWRDLMYRRVSFLTSPSGNLLAWLTDNAVKITDDESYSYNAQNSLTHTVNGVNRESVVPTPPYDSLKRINIITNIVEQATPSIYVNTTTGEITSTVTQTEAGWVKEGTKTATQQLATQAAKTVTPTEAEQTAVASGKYTTGDVVVAAVPTTYVGSGVARKSSSDLTADGATVNVPAGYYEKAASKSVATTTQATPSISVKRTGLVTASVNQSAGYVSAGTISATKQLPTADANNILNNVRVKLGYLSNTGQLSLKVEFDSKSMGWSDASAGKFVEESYLVRNYNVYLQTETKTVELSMASGNQTVTNTEKTLMTAVTVVKPSTLVPSNIKKGVNIGGIVGTYGGDVFIREVSTINCTTSEGAITFTTSRLARYLYIRSGNSYVASADIRSISSLGSFGDLYFDITYKGSTYHYTWGLFKSGELNYDGANMTVYIIYDSL